jgi:hypothetical protein
MDSPVPHPLHGDGLDEEFLAYDGTLRMTVPLSLATNLGPLTLAFELTYQACTGDTLFSARSRPTGAASDRIGPDSRLTSAQANAGPCSSAPSATPACPASAPICSPIDCGSSTSTV